MTNSEKGAITKAFIPDIANKLKLNISLTPNLTSILTGHGKTRAYLHRFKLINNSTCPCQQGSQTVYHLISKCKLLNIEIDTVL